MQMSRSNPMRRSQPENRKSVSRVSLLFAVVVGCACSALAYALQASPGIRQQAKGAERAALQYVTVQDPAFGMARGTMPFFLNWRGSASVDRRDNLGDPVDAFAFTSADGSESIQQLGKSVMTTVLPAMARDYPGMQLMRFSSSGDLLSRVIVRQLALGGQPEDAVQAPEEFLTALRQGLPPDMFVDAATVTIDHVAGGKEVLVGAITAGHNRGQRGENSTTTVTIFTAPAGKVQTLARAFDALPPLIENPAWRRDQQEKDRRGQEQTAQQIADYNKRQAAFNATQEASNAAHRASTGAAFNRNAADVARQQQDGQDNAAVHIGILSGQTAYFKWCSADGGSSQITDSTFAPATGWRRCN